MNIWYEGKRIVFLSKEGKCVFVVFDDMTKSLVSSLGKIQIQCSVCNNTYFRNFRKCYVNVEYVCQSCNKVGVRNPFYGKKHTVETRRRISNVKCGTMTGSCNSFYGKKHTVETIEKIRKANADYQSSLTPSDKQKISQTLSKSAKNFVTNNGEYAILVKRKAAIASSKSQAHYKKNKIENMFHDLMTSNQIEVEYCMIFGSYQYDFGNKQSKTLIEVNGDYWHANPRFYGEGLRQINDTQLLKIARDKEKKEFAITHGYNLLTVWEYDLYHCPNEVLERVKNVISV